MTTNEIIAVLKQAAQANYQDRCRDGNLIRLSGQGDVVMTGDLHGNECNFDRLVRYCCLEENPNRHLILHELLHSMEQETPGECHSYRLVARVAELKNRFPGQVHILLGNHAMAQVCHDEVIKGGQPMVRALLAGLATSFGSESDIVSDALDEFIISLPIAARSKNGVWMSHSLPSLRHLSGFDKELFEKKLTLEDMRSNLSLHALIWDRSHSKKCLEHLSEMWDTEMFIIGHQPQGQGHDRQHDRLIILASDHGHGCFLPFDIGRSYGPDELFGQVRPLAGIA